MMASFRGFIALSSAYRCLVKPKMISLKAVNLAAMQNIFTLETCSLSWYNQARCLATDDSIDTPDITKVAPKRERAKTPEAPKITLLDSNDNITVCTMQEAEKIARSKKLRLVQVVDAKLRTQRPTYKLMSETDYLEEELREKQRVKEEKKQKTAFVRGDKLLTLSTRSTEHDLDVKMNKALKWFSKRYEIRVIILGSPEEVAPQEVIYKKFEKTFNTIGRIVQKRIKNGHLKFQIIPPKREDSESEDTNDNEEKGSDLLEKEEINETKREAVKKSL